MSPAEPTPQPPIEMALIPPKPPPLPSPFLSLPPSLRHEIYLLLLPHPATTPITIYRAPLPTATPPLNPYHTPPPPPHRPYHRSPSHDSGTSGPLHATLLSLFLICHLISHEARTAFYSTSIFTVPSAAVWPLSWARLPLMTRWFVDRIGAHNASALRHLVVPFPLCAERMRRDWLGVERNAGGRGLLPGLGAAAPNLRVLEFEPRSGAELEGVLGACPVAVQREVVCALGEALMEEFVGGRLEEVVLGVYDLVYSCVAGRNRVAEVFRGVVGGCPGWRVKTCGPAPGVCLGVVVRRGVPVVPVLPEGLVLEAEVGKEDWERREREENEERWRCLVEEEPKGRWRRWREGMVGKWTGREEDRDGV